MKLSGNATLTKRAMSLAASGHMWPSEAKAEIVSINCFFLIIL
jgi:hypothetical protein